MCARLQSMIPKSLIVSAEQAFVARNLPRRCKDTVEARILGSGGFDDGSTVPRESASKALES